MTKEPGIYLVTLNNKMPISINAQDPRCADKVYKANYTNIKIGKAKSLHARRDNYYKTFGEHNVNFHPLIFTQDINEVEKTIIKQFDEFRVRNPVSNRKTEWLSGILKDEAILLILKRLCNIKSEYTLSDTLTNEKNPSILNKLVNIIRGQ